MGAGKVKVVQIGHPKVVIGSILGVSSEHVETTFQLDREHVIRIWREVCIVQAC
jgi:hypothetical protein